jgi:hypothetical protein
MSSKADKNLELAQSALAEFSDGSYGQMISQTELEKSVIEFRFDCTKRGYKSWHWVVTLTQPDKRKPATVSEVTLMAGPDALLAPEWIPWAERLKEFRRQLREEGRAKSDAEADALIRRMASGADYDEAEDSQTEANDGGVEPPKKTRVRKRLVKRAEDNDGDGPEEGADQ